MSELKRLDDMRNGKFYCVKSLVRRLTAGRVYEADDNGRLLYDDGNKGAKNSSFADYRANNYTWASCLVPLVARKAYPGEWVYVNGCTDERVPSERNGGVFKVEGRASLLGGVYLSVPKRLSIGINSWLVLDNEYLVLDGYRLDETGPGNAKPAETPETISTEPKKNDSVHSPSHYADKNIEVIDYIRDTLTHDEFVGYCCGNVIKYISRWRKKGGVEDLRKAEVYLGWAEEAVRGKK